MYVHFFIIYFCVSVIIILFFVGSKNYTHVIIFIYTIDFLTPAETYSCYWNLTHESTPIGPCDCKYDIEGNVANGLRALQTYCNTSDAEMVAVLRDSGKNSIHSFKDFNLYHYKLYGCELCHRPTIIIT